MAQLTGVEEIPIQEVTRLTGTTSRTLRHYDATGLLQPARVGAGGTRWYGPAELLRLQRILVLRDLGLPLASIARVVTEVEDETTALRRHLTQLRTEQQRLERQARSVERTITALTTGGSIMAEEMFDGFDHTEHREEVERRWGAQAWADGDRWWRSLSETEQREWQARTADLGRAWTAAAEAGVAPDSPLAQELAARHVAWLEGVPGAPREDGVVATGYVLGLGDLYVADPRFAKSYGGQAGAGLVRDALRAWVAAHR